jgi:hypothetical protein
MALSCGFYNSLDHDRKYNAEQFGSIFDGVIHDGVYMNIGGTMMVKATGSDMTVNIQTGRAWFNHTWTLNDTIYPITLPDAEQMLQKIVAIVLEINNETNVRTNSFKTLVGTPASQNPQRPTLVNTESIHQYPLAYILIKPEVTVIKQEDITNMVGTSACPFVTSVAASMNVDELIAKWENQWNNWFRQDQVDWDALIVSINDQTNRLLSEIRNEFDSFMSDSSDSFDSFINTQSGRINALITESIDRVNSFISNSEDQYTELFNGLRDEANTYFDDSSAAWDNWFQHYQDELSSSQAAHLQAQIDSLSYFYVINRTAFFPNTGVSVTDRRAIFTTFNS